MHTDLSAVATLLLTLYSPFVKKSSSSFSKQGKLVQNSGNIKGAAHTRLFTILIPPHSKKLRLGFSAVSHIIVPRILTITQSTIRQVPDNQEVYLDASGFSSLTFDLTEHQSQFSTDNEALEYHFADIVAEGDSKNIWSVNESVELPKFP